MLEVKKCIENETLQNIDDRQMDALFKQRKLRYVKPAVAILTASSTVKAHVGGGFDGGSLHS